MIANLFERQTIGNKARRTGMTQRMRSAMGNMDAERDEPAVDDIVDGARRDRAPGRLQPDKDFLTRRLRANRIDIARQRFGNGGQKRINLRLPSLQTK